MNDLNNLRKKIDEIDENIISLLKKRFDIVGEIKKIKNENNISVIDGQRQKQLLDLRKSFAKKINISEEFIKKLFSLIHDYSVEIQKK